MNQILTDEDIFKLQYEMQYRDGGFQPIPFARAIERAILNKQSEQEPVCWITPDGEGWRMRLEAPGNDTKLGWTALFDHPAPSVPEGYQLVPIEPTLVIFAALSCWVGSENAGRVYKAMLAAARSE